MSLLNANLQAFVAIYENSTVTAAAKQLAIGQTAITQRLRALESELGVNLFIRSRKGMTLTAEGHSLLKYCQRARELEGETLSEFRSGGSQSEVDVTIAGPTSFISGRVVPQCVEIFKKWPKLNLHFIIDDRENRLTLLKQGIADIVALYPHQVSAELTSKIVKPDEYFLLGHPTWKNRELKEIIANERLFAFHADNNTSLNYLKSFILLKYLKRPRLFVNENLALSALLRSGSGFGLLSKEVAEPFLKNKSLITLNEGRTMKDALAIAWYYRKESPKYLADILRLIR